MSSAVYTIDGRRVTPAQAGAYLRANALDPFDAGAGRGQYAIGFDARAAPATRLYRARATVAPHALGDCCAICNLSVRGMPVAVPTPPQLTQPPGAMHTPTAPSQTTASSASAAVPPSSSSSSLAQPQSSASSSSRSEKEEKLPAAATPVVGAKRPRTPTSPMQDSAADASSAGPSGPPGPTPPPPAAMGPLAPPLFSSSSSAAAAAVAPALVPMGPVTAAAMSVGFPPTSSGAAAAASNAPNGSATKRRRVDGAEFSAAAAAAAAAAAPSASGAATFAVYDAMTAADLGLGVDPTSAAALLNASDAMLLSGARIMRCGQCGNAYHSTCFVPPLRVASVSRWMSRGAPNGQWSCPPCKSCVHCSIVGDQSPRERLLVCDLCDRGFHRTCIAAAANATASASSSSSPPSASSAASVTAATPTSVEDVLSAWICADCVYCHRCGRTTPGDAPTSKWQFGYTLCERDGCANEFVLSMHAAAGTGDSSLCTICQTPYAEPDGAEESGEHWIACDACDGWVHASCEGVDDAGFEAITAAGTTQKFKCLRCRAGIPKLGI